MAASSKTSALISIPDGTLITWGSDAYQQTATTNETVHKGLHLHAKQFCKPVARVACGLYHTIVLLVNGDCYSFGRADHGQLGQGPLQHMVFYQNCNKITFPRNTAPIIDIVAGYYHSGFLTGPLLWCNHSLDLTDELYIEDGKVYECGSGWFEVRQIALPSSEVVKQISAGGCRTFALMESGNVYQWGDNIRRGTPTKIDFFTPDMVVVQLACSLNDCVALTGTFHKISASENY